MYLNVWIVTRRLRDPIDFGSNIQQYFSVGNSHVSDTFPSNFQIKMVGLMYFVDRSRERGDGDRYRRRGREEVVVE